MLKGKNILITGVTGFIGSHLAKRLQEEGATVFGISRHGGSEGSITADILDLVSLDKIIQGHNISICFHLAGEALVESGQKDPYGVFRTNIQGTLNVLECARKYSLERLIIASSSHVYGKNKVPYYEGYTPRPTRPYETSKTCTDLIAQSYAESFALPIFIARFVNIYGPGDMNFNRIIPRTIKSIITGETISMWGGQAVRDYLFIDDAVEAYINLGKVSTEKVKKNKIFNFGSGNMITVEQLVKKIIQISKTNRTIEKIPDERGSEITSQYVSWNKARTILKWMPKVSLDEGLQRALAWYIDYYKKQGIKEVIA